MVAFQPRLDIAVLRVRGMVGTWLSLSTDEIERGVDAFALGYPEGPVLTAPEATVKEVLRVGIDMNDKGVPLDGYRLRARVRHGNSGGPLVLPNGEVVGVVTRGNDRNVGYAVASTEVIPVIRRASDRAKPVDTGRCLS